MVARSVGIAPADARSLAIAGSREGLMKIIGRKNFTALEDMRRLQNQCVIAISQQLRWTQHPGSCNRWHELCSAS
jgi:hypothetical protein